jgi:RNA polymerase sigma factor (sigma-70 family)
VKGGPGERSTPFRSPHSGWSDERLVGACLKGDDAAWSALIDKYKNLIYSIARRYGASPEDAADIFQLVCVELFADLPKLRKTTAVRSWLISVATHQAYHWKLKYRKQTGREEALDDDERFGIDPIRRPDVLQEIEREQMMRDATAQLSPRCQQMIHLLFYVEPPVPYAEVARRLGLATGSIGFIRGRCLEKLQKVLKKMDF